MDGFKRKLANSIRFRLSFWLSLSILAITLIAGALSSMNAYDEAIERQDDELRQIQTLVARQQLQLAFAPGNAVSMDDNDNDGDDEAIRIVIEYLPVAGQSPQPQPMLAVPADLPDGFSTVAIGKQSYRVLIRTFSPGKRLAIAQETDARNEVAFNSAVRTVTPLLLLIPILLAVIARLIQRAFRPVAELASEIDAREEHDLHPVEALQLPAEIKPFVVAINRLLKRVAAAMETQRRFVADAAHELRTPLTALSLQAERLAATEMTPQAHERLDALRAGIDRSRNLLEQLLTLAGIQSADNASANQAVSVLAVYRKVIESLMPLAEHKHMDIGIEEHADNDEVMIVANEIHLYTLIRNLVDNAIRYSPEHGRVDLSIAREVEGVRLQVRDYGPGIPPEEMLRVFDPFYRILGTEQIGSGLGLSIVKTIADNMQARIQFSYTDLAQRHGLKVDVFIPSPSGH